MYIPAIVDLREVIKEAIMPVATELFEAIVAEKAEVLAKIAEDAAKYTEKVEALIAKITELEAKIDAGVQAELAPYLEAIALATEEVKGIYVAPVMEPTPEPMPPVIEPEPAPPVVEPEPPVVEPVSVSEPDAGLQ